MKIIEKIVDFILDQYKALLLIIAVLFFISAYLVVTEIKVENSLKIWFLDNDPHYGAYLDFQEQYGNDDIVTIFAEYPESAICEESARDAEYIKSRLDSLDFIDKVYTVFSADFLNANDFELNIEQVAEEAPQTDSARQEIINRLNSFPVIKNTFLTPDQKGHVIIARLKPVDQIENKRDELIRDIKAIAQDVYPEVNMGGIAVLTEALNRRVAEETSVFTSLSYLIIIVLLSFFIRKRRYLLIAIPSVIVPIAVLFGIFVLAGYKLNMISMIIPTILLVYSIADVVHILNIYILYGQIYKTLPKRDIIKKSLVYSFIPCMFTSVTTMAGYVSFTLSPFQALQTTGIFAFLGVGLAFVLLYILTAAGLMILNVPEDEKEWGISLYFEKLNLFISQKVMTLTSRARYPVIIAFSLLFVIGISLIGKVVVDTHPIEYLDKDEKVRRDSEYLEERMNAYLPFEIVIRSKTDEKLITHDKLKALERFQDSINASGLVFNTSSLVDVVKYLYKQLTENEDNYIIPESNDAIEQSLLLYEMDEDNKLSEMTNVAYSEIRMTGKIGMLSSQQYAYVIERVKKVFHYTIPDNMELEIIPQGYTPLYVILINYTISSQLLSFLGAFILAAFAMFLCFRKLKLVFISLLPNIIPMSSLVTTMVVLDIPLDAGTAMVAAIMLGIAVDDTIHYLHAYLKARKEGNSRCESADRAIGVTGRAIISTSLTLTAGFTIIAMSSVNSLHNYGVLSAITVIVTLLSDYIFLPAILKLRK